MATISKLLVSDHPPIYNAFVLQALGHMLGRMGQPLNYDAITLSVTF